jgi:glycosyltransferase involved in cell wall biosynthesis
MKPTILLIIPNLGRGGAQQVFKTQLDYYSKRFTTIGCVFNWEDSFEEDRKLNIVSLDIPAGKNILSKLYFFWKRISSVNKLKKKFQVTISISHLEGADYVNILSRENDKIITWIHGTKQFDENISGILGMLRKRIFIPVLYKHSYKIVTVSRGIKEELVYYFNLPPGRITIVTNGISLTDILLNSEKEISADVQYLMSNHSFLITHCRLAKQKNLAVLLDVMARLPKDLRLKLIILGDGELREILLRHCLALHLRTFSVWNNDQFDNTYDVYFFGYQHNPYPFIKHASLYVMTSLWEGFPLSLCEALACGLPVMAADCHTGPREILCPELPSGEPISTPYYSPYGILMPIPNSVGQIDVWAKTIVTLIGSPELRSALSTSGVGRVRSFDRGILEHQWLKILSA